MIGFLIVLVVLGLAWYLIETYVPIAEPFKTVIRVVIVLIIVLALLQFAGVTTGLPRLRL